MPVAPEVQARLDFALRAAEEAGTFILSHYQRSDLAVERKRDTSPVTAADRGAEEQIRAAIAREFPGDGVLGEEFGETSGSSGFRWILDPVDGTKSFIHGVPLFGTLIGLERGQECVLGVCRFPALNEVVYAARGGGAWWQIGNAAPRLARASAVSRLEEAAFCITTISGWYTRGQQTAFETLMQRALLTRGWGDCYGHALVATGRAEVMIDPAMNPWDAAALLPIMEEAGGCFVDWSGVPSIYSGNGLSVNAALKDEIIQILGTVPAGKP